MFLRWQIGKKYKKRFGLGSVEILKDSAETEPLPKPLGSAESETETEGSVVHYWLIKKNQYRAFLRT